MSEVVAFTNPPDFPSSGDPELDELIYRAGQQFGVDPRLLHAIILQESRYKADAESGAGAQGLMQLMPAQAKRFKCEDRKDPQQNIEAGAKHLRLLLKRFDGNVALALAGLSAGEGNVDKYEGVPPFPETQKYVKVIVGNYGKNHHPVLKPEEARAAFGLTQQLSITIHGDLGYGKMVMTKQEDGYNKLTITESVTYNTPQEGNGAVRVEVLAVSRVGGCEVYDKRIYYAPALNPGRLRKYRQPSPRAAELLPVGAEFTFWAGEGDDPTPISDKVTITVQPKYNIPVKLQLKDSVASAK